MCATDCMKGGGHRGRERVREERERGIQSYLNGNQKRTEEKGPRVRNKKKEVETGLIYARKKLRHSLRKTRAIEIKRHWIFFSLNVCFCTLMTQRGFQLNSPDREELMVSCWGGRAEGRNLNALG